MIYVYACNGCNQQFDVVKSVAEIDNPEHCPTSGTTMTRAFAPQRVHLFGTAVQEKKWQPALGRAATDHELHVEAKARNWVELGSENPEKHLKPQRSEYPTFSNDELRALTSKP